MTQGRIPEFCFWAFQIWISNVRTSHFHTKPHKFGCHDNDNPLCCDLPLSFDPNVLSFVPWQSAFKFVRSILDQILWNQDFRLKESTHSWLSIDVTWCLLIWKCWMNSNEVHALHLKSVDWPFELSSLVRLISLTIRTSLSFFFDIIQIWKCFSSQKIDSI